jgi:hypothetical protein
VRHVWNGTRGRHDESATGGRREGRSVFTRPGPSARRTHRFVMSWRKGSDSPTWSAPNELQLRVSCRRSWRRSRKRLVAEVRPLPVGDRYRSKLTFTATHCRGLVHLGSRQSMFCVSGMTAHQDCGPTLPTRCCCLSRQIECPEADVRSGDQLNASDAPRAAAHFASKAARHCSSNP